MAFYENKVLIFLKTYQKQQTNILNFNSSTLYLRILYTNLQYIQTSNVLMNFENNFST